MSTTARGLLGSFLLVGEAIANKTIGLVSTLILARLLSPEDFGLVAIGVLLMGFVEVLGRTDGAQYLLRLDEILDEHIDTCWTLNLCITSSLALMLFLSAPYAAHYYGDERLTGIVQFLAFYMAIQCLKNPAEVKLRREHTYLPITKISIFSKIAAVSVAATMAYVYQSYWALLLGQFSQGVVYIIGSYVIAPYKPRLSFSNIKDQWSFSAWIIPQSLVGYARTQLDTFIVSANFGKDMLGSYHVLKYLSYIPSSNIIVPATQPLLVELSKAKNDRFEFTKQFNASFIAVSLLVLPLTAMMSFHHELIVRILLGDKWIEYSILLAAFAFLIPATATMQHANRVLVIHAKTKQIFYYEILTFVSLYSLLLYIGLSDLYVFTYWRVALENVFSVIFLGTVCVKYTSPMNLLKLALYVSSFVFFATVAGLASTQVKNTSDYALINLMLVSLTFSAVFLICITAAHFLFLNRSNEWKYIIERIYSFFSTLIQRT